MRLVGFLSHAPLLYYRRPSTATATTTITTTTVLTLHPYPHSLSQPLTHHLRPINFGPALTRSTSDLRIPTYTIHLQKGVTAASETHDTRIPVRRLGSLCIVSANSTRPSKSTAPATSRRRLSLRRRGNRRLGSRTRRAVAVAVIASTSTVVLLHEAPDSHSSID